jgi:hypothetical protein
VRVPRVWRQLPLGTDILTRDRSGNTFLVLLASGLTRLAISCHKCAGNHKSLRSAVSVAVKNQQPQSSMLLSPHLTLEAEVDEMSPRLPKTKRCADG